jgi:predicted HicB family RNase H-like nuclease
MATEAKRRANIAYNKRRDNLMLRPSKEKGGEIRAAAAAAGQSVQAYSLQAIDERMQREASAAPAASDRKE